MRHQTVYEDICKIPSSVEFRDSGPEASMIPTGTVGALAPMLFRSYQRAITPTKGNGEFQHDAGHTPWDFWATEPLGAAQMLGDH